VFLLLFRISIMQEEPWIFNRGNLMVIIPIIQDFIEGLHVPILLTVGILTILAFYTGRTMKYLRLPSIIGAMIMGALLGPSLINLVSENVQEQLSFITDIALGFVALSIGLELNMDSLKKQGWGIISIILSESFTAFILVAAGIYLLTGDLPLALIFGAVAPASAPAGTVAIIHEYKARGSLTKALYAVVGFDDGLGIIIFGFAAAFAKSILIADMGGPAVGFREMIGEPFKEVVLSLVIGTVIALLFSILVRKTKSGRDIFIVTFATVFIATGIAQYFHFSLILTNMMIGIVAVNTQPNQVYQSISEELREVMPLIFVLFFGLAGSHLHLSLLPALGLIGVIYVVCRTTGLMSGAWFGAVMGKAEKKIRKYLGLGILSQAGVAIGLALIVKDEFTEYGTWGAHIGTVVITTVTVTSIFFEILGPITTKIALRKAGEINTE